MDNKENLSEAATDRLLEQFVTGEVDMDVGTGHWVWAPFYIHGYSGYWELGDISTVMTKPHSDTILPEGLFGSFRILDIFWMSMDIY